MRMNWETLSQSGFFSWFHVEEIGRERVPRGAQVMCKPGAYQEYIDLAFVLDGHANLVQAELALDRTWLDDRRTAPFAGDIAKSFVFLLAGDKGTLIALAQQMEEVLFTIPGVIYRAREALPAPGEVRGAVDAGIAVYLGHASETEVRAPGCVLVLANDRGSRGLRLVITWTATKNASETGILARIREKGRSLLRSRS